MKYFYFIFLAVVLIVATYILWITLQTMRLTYRTPEPEVGRSEVAEEILVQNRFKDIEVATRYIGGKSIKDYIIDTVVDGKRPVVEVGSDSSPKVSLSDFQKEYQKVIDSVDQSQLIGGDFSVALYDQIRIEARERGLEVKPIRRR